MGDAVYLCWSVVGCLRLLGSGATGRGGCKSCDEAVGCLRGQESVRSRYLDLGDDKR